MDKSLNDALLLKLKKVSLFHEIRTDESALIKVASIISRRTFSQKTEIITEGEQGDEMYILNTGKVRIEKNTLEKERYTVANLTDNMNIFFGEIALMDNDIRSASVIAETSCECFVIKQEDFEKLGIIEPQIVLAITREIAKNISARLRKSNQDYTNLFQALINEIEKDND